MENMEQRISVAAHHQWLMMFAIMDIQSICMHNLDGKNLRLLHVRLKMFLPCHAENIKILFATSGTTLQCFASDFMI